ncbi:MAG TPA: transglycosylase SLT domain-containing protein [Gemmatimonadaceae bacterium]|nr:transglycosylase SLT domain-containing protein [Gemmatimonadaceae bacterium]
MNAEPAPAAEKGSYFLTGSEARRLQNELASARGELDLMKAQFERATGIIEYSKRYNITAGMASSIFDAALAEGIDPELAFRLVRLESEFNPRAKSPVGAIGLTQLMPSTARLYRKGVTVDELYDRDTNLRIGFKYLRNLMRLYRGNVELALVAYNRGEGAVDNARKAGIDPRNGYEKAVMGNYKGKGIIQQSQHQK